MSLPSQVIVLICIGGAGLSVLMAYAIGHRIMGPDRPQLDVEAGREFSQAQYMREVRLRNCDNIAVMTGNGGLSHGNPRASCCRPRFPRMLLTM